MTASSVDSRYTPVRTPLRLLPRSAPVRCRSRIEDRSRSRPRHRVQIAGPNGSSHRRSVNDANRRSTCLRRLSRRPQLGSVPPRSPPAAAQATRQPLAPSRQGPRTPPAARCPCGCAHRLAEAHVAHDSGIADESETGHRQRVGQSHDCRSDGEPLAERCAGTQPNGCRLVTAHGSQNG